MLAKPADPSVTSSSSSAFVLDLVTLSLTLNYMNYLLELSTSLPMSVDMVFSICRGTYQGCTSWIWTRVHYSIAY